MSYDDYRLEILASVQRLKRLDKDAFSDEDRQEAARIREERKAEDQLLVSRPESSQLVWTSVCLTVTLTTLNRNY